jgi:hypothetical protein
VEEGYPHLCGYSPHIFDIEYSQATLEEELFDKGLGAHSNTSGSRGRKPELHCGGGAFQAEENHGTVVVLSGDEQ